VYFTGFSGVNVTVVTFNLLSFQNLFQSEGNSLTNQVNWNHDRLIGFSFQIEVIDLNNLLFEVCIGQFTTSSHKHHVINDSVTRQKVFFTILLVSRLIAFSITRREVHLSTEITSIIAVRTFQVFDD